MESLYYVNCLCMKNCCLVAIEVQIQTVAYHITIISLNCVFSEAVAEIQWRLAWSNTSFESHIMQG